jgi:pyruvyltransferase
MLNPFKKAAPYKAYWWKEVPNFGDAMAPLLLEHFAYLNVEWGTVSHSQIASVGSILEHIPPLWDGVILGSGRLIEGSRLQLEGMRSGITAKILALRGPLSAKGVKGSFALGDPGILADELVGGFQEKVWDLGILPHFTDKELIPKFKALIPSDYKIHVIHPSEDPLKVIREIGMCHRLVTSSLHGMIVADAFGIPRRLEYTYKMDKDGKGFKFKDYSASINTPLELGKMVTADRVKVEEVKFQVYDAYRGRLCVRTGILPDGRVVA